MADRGPNLKFQIIEWIDARASCGWSVYQTSDDYGVDVVTSAGWLIRDTKEYITLAGSISEKESNNAMSIPKGWIKKRKTIKIDN